MSYVEWWRWWSLSNECQEFCQQFTPQPIKANKKCCGLHVKISRPGLGHSVWIVSPDKRTHTMRCSFCYTFCWLQCYDINGGNIIGYLGRILPSYSLSHMIRFQLGRYSGMGVDFNKKKIHKNIFTVPRHLNISYTTQKYTVEYTMK